ncbi:hypothetical protein [Ralstonia solanacearum]|uniref:hypothetical protein n=1 Tax=Ralstonia solanacearum TaxID=305 RepID=UPI00202AA4CB|nr:hypothetical protein [Ralstonia solanacearum]MCL9844627.1 hypothetical protein [Ralstonia solanacearum]MDC6253154.1 hypothetical protein [Ralstonia solanacearum]MDC6257736.1 hypothetical protein [Ralstonia solanacearum]MDC6301608.1 hypothetical protein [Ralstonia solanacearum]
MNKLGKLAAILVMATSGSAFAGVPGFNDCLVDGPGKVQCKFFNNMQEYNDYIKQYGLRSQLSTNPSLSQVAPTNTAPAASVVPQTGQIPVAQMQAMQSKWYTETRVLSCTEMSKQERFAWMQPPNPALFPREGEILTRLGEATGKISGGYILDAFTVRAFGRADNYNTPDDSPPTLQFGGAVEERGVQKDQTGNVISTGVWYLSKVGLCATSR